MAEDFSVRSLNTSHPLYANLKFMAVPVGTTGNMKDLVSGTVATVSGTVTSVLKAPNGGFSNGGGLTNAVQANGNADDHLYWPASATQYGGSLSAAACILVLGGCNTNTPTHLYNFAGNASQADGAAIGVVVDSYAYSGYGNFGWSRYSSTEVLQETAGNPLGIDAAAVSGKTHFFGLTTPDAGVTGKFFHHNTSSSWSGGSAHIHTGDATRQTAVLMGGHTSAANALIAHDHYVELVLMFDKDLTLAEYQALYADPWSLLASTNAAPTFPGPNIGNLTGTVGAAFNLNIASKFSDTDALTFSAVGAWPAGVTVSSAGLISGTPSSAATYTNLQVRATDTATQSVTSDTFSFVVNAAGDVTAPTMNGTISATNLTTTSYTLNWSAGSDNVGVTGYQYRINGGAWVDVGNSLSAPVTGRTPGATDAVDVRDYDAASNFSTAISANVTLNSVSGGTFTSEVLKDNVGNVVANKALNFVALYNDTTHALVVSKTGLSTNASGIFTTSDALLTAGQTYRVDWETVDGQRRMPRKAAT